MKKLVKLKKKDTKVYSCYTTESTTANTTISSVIAGTFAVGAVVLASTIG